MEASSPTTMVTRCGLYSSVITSPGRTTRKVPAPDCCRARSASESLYDWPTSAERPCALPAPPALATREGLLAAGVAAGAAACWPPLPAHPASATREANAIKLRFIWVLLEAKFGDKEGKN